MKRVDAQDPERVLEFGTQDPAIQNYYERLDREPTVQIWARTKNASNAKYFLVGPYDCLHEEFTHQVTPKYKLGDEVYLADNPGRLAFDLDGKTVTAGEMVFYVDMLKNKVLAALESRYGLTGVVMRELDGSRKEKQSRHVFFDGAIFADIRHMKRFVLTDVKPGFPGPEGLIDMAIYHNSARCLRLPLAVKFGEDRVLCPVWTGVPFDFSRTMINVLPEHRPEVMLTMPDPRQVQAAGDNVVVARIMRYLEQWGPEQPRGDNNTDKKLHVILKNLWCPRKKGVHTSNNGSFTCGFGTDRLGRPCIVNSLFRCHDPECDDLYWRPREAVEYIAYPEKLKVEKW